MQIVHDRTHNHIADTFLLVDGKNRDVSDLIEASVITNDTSDTDRSVAVVDYDSE